MTDLASPPAARLRQPRWLDGRLVAGVVLILLSIVAGATVLSRADETVAVFALRRTLPAGAVLSGDDVTTARVRIEGGTGERYIRATSVTPAGRVLARSVGAGELLPLAALVAGDAGRALRHVTVPVSRDHALGGELRAGDVVDIVATFGNKAQATVTRPVLRAVSIVDVLDSSAAFGAGGTDFAVVVAVAPEQVLELTAAIQVAQLDLVRVVPGADGNGDIGSRRVVSTPAPAASPR